MTQYLIIPGYQGSGPDHWQTWLEKKHINIHRVQQKDWDKPNLREWSDAIENSISQFNPESVVLVAHSLGCIAVTEWVRRYKKIIKAALLVAPPDVENIRKKIDKNLLDNSPTHKIPFNTALVASSNDPWISIEVAEIYAQNWGSKFINIGDAGHINSLSGYGEWEQGYEILKQLG